MTRTFVGLSTMLLLVLSAPADTKPKANPSVPTPTPVAASNKVDGLKLPDPFSVSYDEGFITITAECKGQVQWLVLSADPVKLKFKPSAHAPEVDVAVPPTDCVISVFAVGLVEGKMTAFARTDVTVVGQKGPGPPKPGPQPTPKPVNVLPIGTPLHVTIVEDPTRRTPELAKVIESPLLVNLRQQGHVYRVYSIRDPQVSSKRLDTFVNRAGGPPALIIQTNDGIVHKAVPVPGTDVEVISIINQLYGK